MKCVQTKEKILAAENKQHGEEKKICTESSI